MDEITLTYLTNPVYFSEMNRKDKPTEKSHADITFYRRRIISLFNELMDGGSANESVDNCARDFIHLAIQHFEQTDTNATLQEGYGDVLNTIFEEDADEEVDDVLFAASSHSQKTPTLDGFVISSEKKTLILPPQRKVINLREEHFRHKDIKKTEGNI